MEFTMQLTASLSTMTAVNPCYKKMIAHKTQVAVQLYIHTHANFKAVL